MIENWLDRFKSYWLSQDIEGVRSLFTDDIEYWETPFKKLQPTHDFIAEWNVIKTHHNIMLAFEIISKGSDVNVIKWNLVYNFDGKNHEWAGLYLVRLNRDGRCSYFYQVGEER